MNMRKYSMNVGRVVALKRLLRREDIRVHRITVAAHDKREDSVYVFFESTAKDTEKDTVALAGLKAKAEEVSKDEVYAKLSNTKQRELYLLDRYGISKRDGVDVIELIKIAEVVATATKVKVDKKAKEEKRDENV